MSRKLLLILILALLLIPTVIFAQEETAAVVLPTPTGAYPVGKRVYAVNVDDTRQILLTVFYPAAETGAAVPYINPAVVEAWRSHPEQPVPGLERLQATARQDAMVAEVDRLPIVLFSPGMGIQPEFYTALLEDLASHGYMVAAINHTHSTFVTPFPDGRIETANEAGSLPALADADQLIAASDLLVAQWANDIRATLDMLESIDFDDPMLHGKFNLGRIGMFGHSFGGAAATEAAHLDERIAVALDMDGSIFGTVVDEGLNKPFMAFFAEESATSTGVGAVLNSTNAGTATWLAGSTHYTFVTDVILLPDVSTDLRGTIDPIRAVEVIRATVRAFFETYLQGEYSPAIFNIPLTYPEITLQTYGS